MKPLSKETREKISKSLKGHPVSEETKQKMRDTMAKSKIYKKEKL